MVLRDMATLMCVPIACALSELTASSVVFAPVVLPSRPLFCLHAGVLCLLFVLVLQVSTIPAHLFLMLVAALGSLYKTITMISRLINDKRLT